MPSDLKFKTIPFDHQDKILRETVHKRAHGLLMDMGTGKTKIVLDTLGNLFVQGKILGMIVVAPNAVYTNWSRKEIPAHLIDEAADGASVVPYACAVANRKWFKAKMSAALSQVGKKMVIITLPYSAFRTIHARTWLWEFMKRCEGRFLYVLDESHFIKDPSTDVSSRIIESSKFAHYRRILTGTPIGNGPFDIYAQIKFLHQDFWRDRGIRNFTAFKSEFAVFRRVKHTITTKKGTTKEITIPHVSYYRNLEKLRDMVEPVTTRVTKDILNLPEKLYTQRYFDLHPEQRKAYEALKNEFMLEISDDEYLTADNVMVRLLRLQQITCGYIPLDEGPPVKIKNARIEAMAEVADEFSGKVIAWGRFDHDIDELLALAAKRGEKAVRYDGKVPLSERPKAIDAFQDGDAKWFIGKDSSAGTGLTLHAAAEMVYYSSSYSLLRRLQSEDRIHRIGQTRNVLYVDLIAAGTVDEKIREALIKKQDIANQITGDEFKQWIR